MMHGPQVILRRWLDESAIVVLARGVPVFGENSASGMTILFAITLGTNLKGRRYNETGKEFP
jgi:hypothetical protein